MFVNNTLFFRVRYYQRLHTTKYYIWHNEIKRRLNGVSGTHYSTWRGKYIIEINLPTTKSAILCSKYVFRVLRDNNIMQVFYIIMACGMLFIITKYYFRSPSCRRTLLQFVSMLISIFYSGGYYGVLLRNGRKNHVEKS